LNDRAQQVADLRARIADVRSRFGWDQTPNQSTQAQPKPVVAESQPKQSSSVERSRVSNTPKIELNWDADARAAEMNAMKAKLMGKKK